VNIENMLNTRSNRPEKKRIISFQRMSDLTYGLLAVTGSILAFGCYGIPVPSPSKHPELSPPELMSTLVT